MVNTSGKYKFKPQNKRFQNKKLENGMKKNTNNDGTEIPERGMLFANRKELWVCNGESINIYNPVSGSLIDVKEKHKEKVISLCRISDSSEEDYEIVSCDEKGFVCHWISNKDQNHVPDKSFSIPIEEKEKITNFCYGDSFSVATLTFEGTNLSNLVYVKHKKKGDLKPFIITKDIKQGQYKVALSYDKQYVAALKERILYVRDLLDMNDKEGLLTKHHKTGQIDYHCIAFHPTKYIIAAGGLNGCVTLYYQFMNTSPTIVRLHWHTMPVQTICFSSTGGDLYSGGKESVLVRWYLTDDNRKRFLPRLGMPIQNLQTDPSNTYVAILHVDDSISIVNSLEMKLEGTVQRLSKNISTIVDSNSPSNKILLYHKPSGSFIKNGKTGYLQFFDPLLTKVNYDLDVTMTNFISEERNRKLPNVEITNAAISENGVWLTTVEMCYLSPTLKEIIMKFWYYSLATKRWELNTTIHSPHLDTITALAFCPLSKELVPTCISCSEDGKFKVWKLVTYEDLTGSERNLWNSQTSRDFRDLPATACAFSQDTSLLAVAFESVVSLWCPEEVVLKKILTQSFLTETIKTIVFSHERWRSSSLITRSENYICTWDILSCTLIWRAYLPSSCLVIDSQPGLLAAFSKTGDVFFFGPQSPEPISSNHNIESEVLCAVFTPYVSLSEDKMKNTSTLFYCDKNQNLHRIDSPSLVQRDPSKKSKRQYDMAVEDVNVDVERDIYHSSDLFASFSAKTKNITKKNSEEGIEPAIDLIAPSLKNLLDDLHDVQIHNLTFSGLVEHMSSFLPNVCLIPEKDKKSEQLKYVTFDDEKRRRNQKTETLDSYFVEESKRIEEIKNYDFNQLVDVL